jgi:hypothetical protein
VSHTSKHDRLEAYLDGSLSPAEAAAFAREAAADPELRDLVSRQSAIDDALRDLFPVPPSEQLVSTARLAASVLTPTAPRADGKLPGRRRLLAVAALIGVISFSGWRLYDFAFPPPPPDVYGWRSFADVYRQEADGPYTPTWICTDDAEFIRFTKERFGTPLVLAALPPGVEVLGWSYAPTMSRNTAYILARINGEAALVFVDLASADSGHGFSPAGDAEATRCRVKHFERTLGPFRIYEVTRLAAPRVLDLLQLAPA